MAPTVIPWNNFPCDIMIFPSISASEDKHRGSMPRARGAMALVKAPEDIEFGPGLDCSYLCVNYESHLRALAVAIVLFMKLTIRSLRFDLNLSHT